MKKAIVLGASGRLGSEITRKLISIGYEVIGTYRDKNHLPKDLVENKKVVFYPIDFKQKSSIEHFLKSIKEEKIDFITNTISNKIFIEKVEKISTEIIEEDFRVNVTNYLYFLQKVIPNLSKNSQIVFILSEMVLGIPKNYLSSYIITKYALLGLMKCMSEELKLKGIRVNAVSPGMMDTNFTWNVKFNGKEIVLPKDKRVFVNPSEVAEKILEIISNESINGKNIPILSEK